MHELRRMWPDCKMLNGRSRHSQSQGSVERCQDVKNMLRSWMRVNNFIAWSIGCYFVQYQRILLIGQ